MAATALRSNVADTRNRVAYQGERIELERHGKAVAAMVSIEGLELLEAHDEVLTVLVVTVGHRRDVYQRRWRYP